MFRCYYEPFLYVHASQKICESPYCSCCICVPFCSDELLSRASSVFPYQYLLNICYIGHIYRCYCGISSVFSNKSLVWSLSRTHHKKTEIRLKHALWRSAFLVIPCCQSPFGTYCRFLLCQNVLISYVSSSEFPVKTSLGKRCRRTVFLQCETYCEYQALVSV